MASSVTRLALAGTVLGWAVFVVWIVTDSAIDATFGLPLLVLVVLSWLLALLGFVRADDTRIGTPLVVLVASSMLPIVLTSLAILGWLILRNGLGPD